MEEVAWPYNYFDPAAIDAKGFWDSFIGPKLKGVQDALDWADAQDKAMERIANRFPRACVQGFYPVFDFAEDLED